MPELTNVLNYGVGRGTGTLCRFWAVRRLASTRRSCAIRILSSTGILAYEQLAPEDRYGRVCADSLCRLSLHQAKAVQQPVNQSASNP